MAITVTTYAANDNAAFSPVIVAGTTTRNPFTGGVRQTHALTLIDNNGGFVRLTMASTADLLALDTILISGATGTFLQFNGRHNITSLTATTVTLSTVWATATTGTYGTLNRMNDNLYIKATVKNASSVVLGSTYAFVDTLTGAWTVDISKLMQYELGSIFDITTTGVKSTALASHIYKLELYESWQAADYSVSEYTHPSTYLPTGHRCTSLATTYLLTDDIFYKDKIFVHAFIDRYTTDGHVNNYILKFTSSLGVSFSTLELTATRGHIAYTYQPAINNKWVKIELIDNISLAVMKTIYARAIGCASTLLYYINRLGGYESYEFDAWERDQNTTKVDKYVGEAWEEKRLRGKEYGLEAFKNIRDIVTSPEVYDEALTLVRVLTDNINYRAELVRPTVLLRYDETLIQ